MDFINLHFWYWYLPLNLLFFLPLYLLHSKESSFLPYKGFSNLSTKRKIGYPFYRYNYDPFRVNVDFATTILVLFLLRDFVPFWLSTTLLVIVFLIGFIYNIYYFAINKIYSVQPNFHNDWSILKIGFEFNYYPNKLRFVLLSALLLGFLFSLGFAVAKFAEFLMQSQLGWLEIGFLGATFLINPLLLKRYNPSYYMAVGIASPLTNILDNIKNSKYLASTFKDFDKIDFTKFNFAANAQLKTKPNIYLFGVESYGSVLYQFPDFFEKYKGMIKNTEQKLKANDWHIASNLSTSPIMGGGSWLSYTSVQFGVKIENLALYNKLYNNKGFEKYQGLFQFLRAQGYTNFQLSGMGGYDDLSFDYEKLKSFYSTDHFIGFNDLEYIGPKIGMGNTPPDQFTLNRGFEILKEKSQTPFCLFWLSNNSHFWWETPTKLADDWKTLNKEDLSFIEITSGSRSDVKGNYIKSIKYQLEIFSDFILNQADDEALIILFGDHQPAVFPNNESNQNTPIHIISKNKNFIQSLSEYGFEEGLLVQNRNENNLNHEGIYSLVLRELIRNYGDEKDFPTYLPNGIDLVKP